ncbi:predicted protein [Naegleria gruberi]|uniref:Predicted protein n=1 Tax=Naegleria gruberi TaxID=5762 RepID=D2W3F2_NAEGR|nr:uncharacterized protein NAEGRDRAFT_75923 [Naegleria gruberi]EFC36410.1 predicted protein [Naegleria gruberi]|eukprot:XP_002669154.1 predicted protein [Naegleria gruberi strain NEG-M]
MATLKLGEGLIFLPRCLSSEGCKQIIAENSKKIKSFYNIEIFNDQQLSDKIFEKCKNSIRQLIGINDSDEDDSKFLPVGIDSLWAVIKDNISWSFSCSKRCTHENLSNESKGQMRIFIQLSKSSDSDSVCMESRYGTVDVGKIKRGDAFITFEPNQYSIINKQTMKDNIFLIGYVIFEKNQQYENKLAAKYCNAQSNLMSYESSSEKSIILNISGKEFEIPIIQIRKFPHSILNILIDSPMAEDVILNEKLQRVFPFPNQNVVIFERFILPIILEYSYLDIPIGLKHSLQLEISNEFKFWGFLSPYESESLSKDNQFSNKRFPFKSTELSLISNALYSQLENEKKIIEAKISVMNAFGNIQKKILHDFTHPHNKPFESLSQKEKVETIGKVSVNLMHKFECVPLAKLYDNNYFLIGSDRFLYHT